MTVRTPMYRPRRISVYVPAMGYAADVARQAPFEVIFGPMAAAVANNILNGQSVAAIGNVSTFLQDNTDPVLPSWQSSYPYGPGFGRTLQIAASGASTAVVTVRGRDYLGQPMTENFTLAGAGAVLGNKAFKYVDNVSWPAGAGAVTITLGTGAKLGLPYRAHNVLSESVNGNRVATVGAFTDPSFVDPAAAITGDPRGLYTPTTVLDGSKVVSALFLGNPTVNGAGNGGLHGIPHYGA